jgi:hypothetical protein
MVRRDFLDQARRLALMRERLQSRSQHRVEIDRDIIPAPGRDLGA